MLRSRPGRKAAQRRGSIASSGRCRHESHQFGAGDRTHRRDRVDDGGRADHQRLDEVHADLQAVADREARARTAGQRRRSRPGARLERDVGRSHTLSGHQQFPGAHAGRTGRHATGSRAGASGAEVDQGAPAHLGQRALWTIEVAGHVQLDRRPRPTSALAGGDGVGEGPGRRAVRRARTSTAPSREMRPGMDGEVDACGRLRASARGASSPTIVKTLRWWWGSVWTSSRSSPAGRGERAEHVHDRLPR